MNTTSSTGLFQVPDRQPAPAGALWLGNAAARVFLALQGSVTAHKAATPPSWQAQHRAGH